MQKPTNKIYSSSIKIQQSEISYKYRFSSKAQRLRLQISLGNELEVVLPRGYELKEAENFILTKSKWIKKHLSFQPVKKKNYYYFGNRITIRQEFALFIKKHIIRLEKDELKIISPENSNIELNKLYNTWLRNQAKEYLPERAAELANQFGFSINKISVRKQKTRWGSYSSQGNISFNFLLLGYTKEVIDYVIIHELCHSKEMNHSEDFWTLVKRFCPRFMTLRQELKRRNEL
ncbi:MAG TPA: SprT family zinc-dependent metalloprotease [Ignavibacteriaceae bacterium]|nr:SprT family zinc-dependent metalloprotease [Ignavibacteriaceae bacterium]